MMRLILPIALVSLALLSQKVLAGDLPDPILTPGVARQVDVKTLCTTSTKLVRNVPSSVKKQAYTNYGHAMLDKERRHNLTMLYLRNNQS